MSLPLRHPHREDVSSAVVFFFGFFQRALTEIYNLPADNAGNAVVRRAPDEEKSNAADKVWQYFDGATTKRLLRYYGQDYIQLGLALPEWLAHIPYPEE